MKFKRVPISISDTKKKVMFIHITKPEGFKPVDKKLEDISNKLLFNIKTYEKLAKSTDWQFNLTMKKPIYEFMNLLSQKERDIIFEMYCKIKYELENNLSINFHDVIENIALIIDNVNTQINLVSKLREYVINSKNISFPDLSNKGNRPQDRKEKTFVMSEYIDLTVLSIICKMFAPVFGDIIGIYFKRNKQENNTDKLFKERFSMGILKYIFEKEFSALIEKLKFYIGNEINKKREISQSLSGLFKGYTVNNIENYILSALFIKKFVNVNLYRKDGDMMVYIISCTKYTLNSTIGGLKSKTDDTIKERFTPSDFGDKFGIDDNKKSNLEVESFDFDFTIDIPVLSKIGMNKLINDKLKEFDIDIDIYNEIVDYYFKSIINVTPINKFIISLFFSNELGSSVGIQMIDSLLFSKAVAFLQIYMINKDFKSLVHLMSIIPQTKIKAIRTVEDNKIIISKGQGIEYRVCRDNFAHLDNFYNWDTYITKDICDFIINSYHDFNTSPLIWKMLNEENKNGNDFTYSDSVINDIYRFISFVLEKG